MKSNQNSLSLIIIFVVSLILIACNKEETIQFLPAEIGDVRSTSINEFSSDYDFRSSHDPVAFKNQKSKWGEYDLKILSIDPFVFQISSGLSNYRSRWTSVYRLPEHYYLIVKDIASTYDGGTMVIGELLKKDALYQELIMIKLDRSGNLSWNLLLGMKGYQSILTAYVDKTSTLYISAKSSKFESNEELYLASVSPSGNLNFANQYLRTYSDITKNEIEDLGKLICIKTGFEHGQVNVTFDKVTGQVIKVENLMTKTPLPSHDNFISLKEKSLILERLDVTPAIGSSLISNPSSDD